MSKPDPNKPRPPSQPQPQPESDDQSGSTGRSTENVDTGKNTGQDHYGQSGFAGKTEDVERAPEEPVRGPRRPNR